MRRAEVFLTVRDSEGPTVTAAAPAYSPRCQGREELTGALVGQAVCQAVCSSPPAVALQGLTAVPGSRHLSPSDRSGNCTRLGHFPKFSHTVRTPAPSSLGLQSSGAQPLCLGTRLHREAGARLPWVSVQRAVTQASPATQQQQTRLVVFITWR